MKKIVVIDDCRFTQTVIKDILESAGYAVCSATSGLEANQFVFVSPRPHLLLVDVEMPLLSGDRAVRFFRERSSCRTLPILLMSAKTDSELSSLAQSSGANGYLRKPLRPETLLSTVETYLATQ